MRCDVCLASDPIYVIDAGPLVLPGTDSLEPALAEDAWALCAYCGEAVKTDYYVPARTMVRAYATAVDDPETVKEAIADRAEQILRALRLEWLAGQPMSDLPEPPR